MTISKEKRELIVTWVLVDGFSSRQAAFLGKVHRNSVSTFVRKFLHQGTLEAKNTRIREGTRKQYKEWVNEYFIHHPQAYLHEVQHDHRKEFNLEKPLSLTTIFRLVVKDCGLTRKVIERRCMNRDGPLQLLYIRQIRLLLRSSCQLLFIDETSKDKRDCLRRCGRSRRGTKVIAGLPAGRGKRYSAVACWNRSGFLEWSFTPGTFTRSKYHRFLKKKVLRHIHAWPGPNSIVVLDNAIIHRYPQFVKAIQKKGAFPIFLPPYCPHFNPIEIAFSLVKKALQSFFFLMLMVLYNYLGLLLWV
eukprot:TRINITY_DN2074_c1_g1_i3.p1 TRINITY_DN2074_c1_g1~~TRINITY_DN2074_c1_g1_i3.p1  ORF type:complete len:302 (+),score=22.67 TRINITY_DN2074_c1_g1_i3:817-1722(+)